MREGGRKNIVILGLSGHTGGDGEEEEEVILIPRLLLASPWSDFQVKQNRTEQNKTKSLGKAQKLFGPVMVTISFPFCILYDLRLFNAGQRHESGILVMFAGW